MPAPLVEARLRALVQSICRAQPAEPLDCIRRIDIGETTIALAIGADQINPARLDDQDHITVAPDRIDGDALRITLPARVQCRAGRSWIIDQKAPTRHPDPVLINALRAAHHMVGRDRNGQPRLETAPASPYHRRLVRLAFLAPDLQRAILEGTQPPGLTLQHLMETPIPASWTRQAELFAVATPA